MVDLYNGDCLELVKDIPDGSVACVRNGRNFIGMELQEKYYEVANGR